MKGDTITASKIVMLPRKKILAIQPVRPSLEDQAKGTIHVAKIAKAS